MSIEKIVVVSGVNGFVGQHLTDELIRNNVSVIGIGREQEANPNIAGRLLEYHSADLTKEWPKTTPASAVIHLAGIAAVGASFKNPQETIDINKSMVENMCKHYAAIPDETRVIFASSGSMYATDQPMPVNETSRVVSGPTSPYTESKKEGERILMDYGAKGLDYVIVRPFNHIGPGQREGFFVPDKYDELESAFKNKMHIIKTGNPETKRDYTDVRDVVKAYCLLALASQLQHRLYNICSGRSLSGTVIIENLKAAMGITDVEFVIDPKKVRKNDIMDIVGDSSRIQQELGWKPKITDISDTIRDFVASKKAA